MASWRLFPAKPDDAFVAAVGMQKKLVEEYNGHRAKSGYPPIGIGIGVNNGKLMLGTVGKHERMDGSVIADTVNLCSRLGVAYPRVTARASSPRQKP